MPSTPASGDASQEPRTRRPDTLAVRVGRESDPSTGAVTPPIVLSTTFERDEQYEPLGDYVYARTEHPTRSRLEAVLGALEGGAAAAVFASGQAATTAVLHSLSPGDHVLLPDDLYYGTRAALDRHYARWGIEWTAVDMSSLDVVRAAIRPSTALAWVETPSNPTLKCTDIAGVVEVVRSTGRPDAFVVVDNTWATPIFTSPLALGADLVMHSTTKQIGGHSDVLGGALVTGAIDERWNRISDYRSVTGAVPSPFDSWLLLRSAPTLPIRARAQAAAAARIAEWCATQGTVVEKVHYPGLSTHPGHDVAARQMRNGFGSMLSIEVHGGAAAARAVAGSLRLFVRATSLGGVESLVEHRLSVEGPTSVAPPGLLRLSVGLEDVEDLIEDLAAALGR
jgi:cystathionine gamma-synthase